MAKVKVGVVGYGTIGERIADGVAAQGDMELVGVCDLTPTVPVRALIKSGKDMPLYCAVPEKIKDLEKAGGKVAGTLEDLLKKVEIVCDATTFIHAPPNQSAAHSSRKASWRGPRRCAPGTSPSLTGS